MANVVGYLPLRDWEVIGSNPTVNMKMIYFTQERNFSDSSSPKMLSILPPNKHDKITLWSICIYELDMFLWKRKLSVYNHA